MTLPVTIHSSRPGSNRKISVDHSLSVSGGALVTLTGHRGTLNVSIDRDAVRDMIDAFAEIFGEDIRLKRTEREIALAHNKAEFDKLPIGVTFVIDDPGLRNLHLVKLTAETWRYADGDSNFWVDNISSLKRTFKVVERTSGDLLRELAVGDQFTLDYPNSGRVVKGIKIDADRVYNYSASQVQEIVNFQLHAKLTKENA